VKSHSTAIALSLLAVAGLTGTASGRWIVLPLKPIALGSGLGLSQNNGWSVTRQLVSPNQWRIHVVYTDNGTVVHKRTDNHGASWVSWPPDAGSDAVISSLDHNVAVAYRKACTYPPDPNYVGTFYQQSTNDGVYWRPDIKRISAPEDDYIHYDIRHPSIVVAFHSGPGYGAEAVWVDTVEDTGEDPPPSFPPGRYGWYNAVDMATNTPSIFDLRFQREAEDLRLVEFPTVAWDGYRTGNDNVDCFIAFQNRLNPNSEPEIFLGFHKDAAPSTWQQVTYNTYADERPSVQVIVTENANEDDTLFVAYQRTDGGAFRIRKVLVTEASSPYWADEEFISNLLPPGANIKAPNLWRSGGVLYLGFTADLPQEDQDGALFVAASYAHLHPASSWTNGNYVRLPGVNESELSIYGDDEEVDAVFKRASSPRVLPGLILCVIQREERVAWGPGIRSPGRVLQQVGGSGGPLQRVLVADSFVSMDLSTDNGATWVNAGSPGYGGKPALALDSDSILCAAYVASCTLYCNWWYPEYYDWVSEETVYIGGEHEVLGQPSVALYPGKSDGVKVAGITWVVYDSSAGTSRTMLAKCDTGRVVLDTVEHMAKIDSCPSITIAGGDTLYCVFQRDTCVVEKHLNEYGAGDWNRPPAWSNGTVVSTYGRHPSSLIEDGDYLHATWNSRVVGLDAETLKVIETATLYVGDSVPLFGDWTDGANPSKADTCPVDNSSYCDAGVSVWQQRVSGIWRIMGSVRGDTVTLASVTDTDLLCPHAVAESSAISPSIDQVRVKLLYTKEQIVDGDTCHDLCFETDSFNVSNAGPNATSQNNGVKLIRQPDGDSLFAAYCDKDGAVEYARSADGDSWVRSVVAQGGYKYPAIAQD